MSGLSACHSPGGRQPAGWSPSQDTLAKRALLKVATPPSLLGQRRMMSSQAGGTEPTDLFSCKGPEPDPASSDPKGGHTSQRKCHQNLGCRMDSSPPPGGESGCPSPRLPRPGARGPEDVEMEHSDRCPSSQRSRLRQEDCHFKDSLGYMVKLRPNQTNTNNGIAVYK